jgi:YVTN family beta-propeller protein
MTRHANETKAQTPARSRTGNRYGRLLLTALGTLAALAPVTPGSAAAQGASGWTAYVGNDLLSGAVTPFNTATDESGATISGAGEYPDAIAISPNGRIAYVADYYGEVTPIELSNGRALTMIEVGTYPRAIAITPNGQTAYVANEGSNSITPIDLVTGAPGKEIKVSKYPTAIAIAPDGQTAYVTNYETESVTPIDLSTDVAETPIHVGVDPIAIAITPNGVTAYVVCQGSGSGSNGIVVPIELGTAHVGTAVHVGTDFPEGLAIAPSGQTAYVTDYGGAVTPIDIAEDKAQTPIDVGEELDEIAITPDGRTAYATNFSGTKVTSIDLQTDGVGPSFTGSNMHGLAITPDPAPVAAFSFTAAAPGLQSSFDGSSSSSEVGSIASYEWNFGDGHSEVTTAPTTSHAYATPGVYGASLTVTDSAGTSLAQVFTGQTMSLDGGPQATTTQTVTISAAQVGAPSPGGSSHPIFSPMPPAPTLSDLAQSHAIWSERAAVPRSRDIRPLGTTFSFNLNMPANVSLTFSRVVGGRKVGGRCRPKTSSNSHRPSCTRVVLAGRLLLSAHTGVNQIRFRGRISASKILPAGRYTLVASATAGGATSAPLRVSFKIAAR